MAVKSFIILATGGKISKLYLNVVHFFSTSVNGRGSAVNRVLDGSTYPT
jgi:hypothetical protein